MAAHLDDLFDVLDLEAAIEAGYVRTQQHPEFPLTIFNYTEKAAYERAWTPVTRQCRGLIADSNTNEIIARPFPKFMNASEPGSYAGQPGEQVIVTEKQDGSLAIGYDTAHGYAIATRGSFASEQALHATALWRSRYAAEVKVPDGLTPLWEVVYPANRIVVDYASLDDLILLGAVDIATGRSFDPTTAQELLGWPGPVTEVFPFRTYAEALAAPPRPNREGFVIHFPDADERTKWKYEEYIRLHRIVTGMNERVVWEQLGAGVTVEDLCSPLPDEFHQWVRDVAGRLTDECGRLLDAAQAAHTALIGSMPQGWTRKDYALAAEGELRPWMFNLLDGQDPRARIWRTLRPSGAVTLTSYTEDAA